MIDHAISDLLNPLKASSFSRTFLYNSVAVSETSAAEGISVPVVTEDVLARVVRTSLLNFALTEGL